MANIGVIGAGSWGTALALLLDKNGQSAARQKWSHRPEEAEELSRTREHKSKLPGVKLPETNVSIYRRFGRSSYRQRGADHGGAVYSGTKHSC